MLLICRIKDHHGQAKPLTNENVDMLKVGQHLLTDGDDVLFVAQVALVADDSAATLAAQLGGQFAV